jgi:hypothetical protein
MRQNSKFIVFLGLFLFSGLIRLNAQEQEKPLPRYAVSIEPFYLYNGGLRLNIEKRLDPKKWIELNITGYWLPYSEIKDGYSSWADRGGWYTSNSDFNEFTKLNGFGLGGTYKYYFYSTCFLSAGASYTYYGVQYEDRIFSKYMEDGLPFYEYGLQNINQQFQKVTGNACIGAHSFFRHTYSMEFYGGIGYAHSFYDKDKRHFDETVFGFGHIGLYPMFGFKIGFNIR